MLIPRILSHAKNLISLCTKDRDITIDATVGNGNDTLFLAKLVGNDGIVFGFDIQDQAISNTKKLLNDNNIGNVILFKSGHENVKSLIPVEFHKKISSCIFNLGYLPKGDESITTKSSTTISAIKQLLEIIKINGIIVIVVYSGHPEGKVEMENINELLISLDQKYYQVLQYRFINNKNDAPFIYAIEKITE